MNEPGIAEFFYKTGGRWFPVTRAGWWIEFPAGMGEVQRALMARAHAQANGFVGYRLGVGTIFAPEYTTEIIPVEVTVSQIRLQEYRPNIVPEIEAVELTIEDWRQRRDRYRAQIGTGSDAEEKYKEAQEAIKSFNRNGKLPRWALRDK